MKKLSLVLAAALLLAGCSSSGSSSGAGTIDTKVTDASKDIIQVDDITITKQDIFETFMESYGADQILNKALQAIAAKEIEDTTPAEEAAQSSIDSYIAYLGSEEAVEEYVINNGYESLDQYKEDVLVPTEMQTLLIEKYIDDNYSELCQTYGFTYIRYFTEDLESDAITDISAIDNGEKTFEELAATKTEDGSVPETTLISTVYSGDDVDSTLVTMAAQFTTEGMYSVPITLSDSTYAVVQIVSRDMSECGDDVTDALENNDDFVVTAEAYYLKKYNFTVYESTLKDSINAISDQYFADDSSSEDSAD